MGCCTHVGIRQEINQSIFYFLKTFLVIFFYQKRRKKKHNSLVTILARHLNWWLWNDTGTFWTNILSKRTEENTHITASEFEVVCTRSVCFWRKRNVSISMSKEGDGKTTQRFMHFKVFACPGQTEKTDMTCLSVLFSGNRWHDFTTDRLLYHEEKTDVVLLKLCVP